MSRYLILILLNTPIVIVGLVNAVVSYKLMVSNSRHLFFRIIFWVGIYAGLLFAEPIYAFLFSNNLTQSEPLSLFDVIEITGIIFTLLLLTRAYSRLESLERRVQNMHRELSIRLSNDEEKK